MTAFPVLARKVDTNDILVYLRNRYKWDGWKKEYVAFEELRMGPAGDGQRIDFWVMNCWGNHGKKAFEIKISRGDFLKEIKKPTKRRCALSVSNQYYFIVPKGLLKVEEIPPECGLIEVWWTNNAWDIERINKANEERALENAARQQRNEEHLNNPDQNNKWWCPERMSELAPVPELREFLHANTIIEAPFRDCFPPTWNFVIGLSRRMHEEAAHDRKRAETANNEMSASDGYIPD